MTTDVVGARLEAMVGFRNIAVHDDDRIDPAILKAILTDHLVDLEEYSRAMTASLA